MAKQSSFDYKRPRDVRPVCNDDLLLNRNGRFAAWGGSVTTIPFSPPPRSNRVGAAGHRLD